MPKEASEALAPYGLDRIVFFSDAVIALAITLLVPDIKLPESAGAAAAASWRVLDLWPKYRGYVVSFWVIALYWVAHHGCYLSIRRYDRRHMYLNFLFLMCIAFMPFPTGPLFSSPIHAASVVMYAGTAAGIELTLAGLWVYAVRHHFVWEGLARALTVEIRPNLLPPWSS